MYRLAQAWSTNGQDPAQLKDLEVVFANVISAAIPLSGIVLFFILMLGGFNLVTSGGDPGKVKKAWSTITWGFIGLLLIIASYLIIRFIGDFTHINVGEFVIKR